MRDSSSTARRSLLILRHEPFECLGRFVDILEDCEIPFSYRDLDDTTEPNPHAGLIVTGGPQSANDPQMATELNLIRQALGRRIPLLGICLGAQLIAKALGAEVFRNREKEIGWAPVYFTDAALGDPVFGGLPSPATFFHWHSETFTLPEGADWLAYSDHCRQQAFRYRDGVYGIQFHPEITPEMIAEWSAQPASCEATGVQKAPIDPYAADTAPLARHILKGWLDTFW